MKMMPPDVISHENQLQHLSEPSIFILNVFRTADHAGQIFIPHRLYYRRLPTIAYYVTEDTELVGENSVKSRLSESLAAVLRIIVSQVAVVSFQSEDLCRLPASSTGGQLTLCRAYMPSMPSRPPNLVR